MIDTLGLIGLILCLDLLTAITGFKESWGYSQRSYEGMIKIFGKKWDHFPFYLERGAWSLIAVLSFIFIGDVWELLVVISSFYCKFMVIHMYSYNWSMVQFNKEGYTIGISESEHTTAEKSSSLLKISLFIIGILIPVTYFIIAK